MARLICFSLLTQLMARAFSRAWANTGKRIAARIAIMAMKTSNSLNVKPNRLLITQAPLITVLRVAEATDIASTRSEGPDYIGPHSNVDIVSAARSPAFRFATS